MQKFSQGRCRDVKSSNKIANQRHKLLDSNAKKQIMSNHNASFYKKVVKINKSTISMSKNFRIFSAKVSF